MDFHSQLEASLWKKFELEIEREKRDLRFQISQLKPAQESLARRTKLALRGFIRCKVHLLSFAKVTWWMTKPAARDSGTRKDEVSRNLARLLSSEKKSVVRIVTARLNKRPARRLRQDLLHEFALIADGCLTEFEESQDPRQGREAAPSAETSMTSYNPRLKIVFLTADASRNQDGQRPGSALNLDVEFRQIQKSIQASTYREQIDLETCLATTRVDFLDALNRQKPQIVHFSGHGSRNDGIRLQKSPGVVEDAGFGFLAKVFSTLASSVHLVVLNACYSEEQAQAISSAIPVTIGTPRALGDADAVEFSAAFYGAIANGRSVQEAFVQAEALLEDTWPANRPVMSVRPGMQTENLVLVRTPETESFAPFGVALQQGIEGFMKVNPKLMDILQQGEWFGRAASTIPVLELPEGSEISLGNLAEPLDAEVERARAFRSKLHQLNQTWSRFFGEKIVGKFAALEQSVETVADQLSQETRLINSSTAMVVKMLQEKPNLVGAEKECVVRLGSLLGMMLKTLKSQRQNIALYYNQLIEVLPADLRKTGLVKAVDAPSE